MVNSINSNFPAPDIKSREGKQNTTRSADSEKNRSDADVSASQQLETAASRRILEPFINLSIASANREAARFNIEDGQEADRVLLVTAELMKNNPAMSEAAQANIPSQIVLSLFGNK